MVRSSGAFSGSARFSRWTGPTSTNTVTRERSFVSPGPRQGIRPLSRVLEPDQFPWATEQLRGGHIVRFSRLDELPEQAWIDRQSYQRSGTQSDLSLPLRAGESLLGVLSFDSIREERAWPDELQSRLQLLAEIFTGALERRRAELALNERQRFEALLWELSAVFSGLPALDVDQEIIRGLRRIVDFLDVDQGSLVEFAEGGRLARITHSWMAEGVVPAPSAITFDQTPWAVARLQGGEVVRFSRLDELAGEDAARDRRTYLALGIKSRVEVPLMVGETAVGALALSTLGAERAVAGRPGAAPQALRGSVRQCAVAQAGGDGSAGASARSRPRRSGGHRGRAHSLAGP